MYFKRIINMLFQIHIRILHVIMYVCIRMPYIRDVTRYILFITTSYFFASIRQIIIFPRVHECFFFFFILQYSLQETTRVSSTLLLLHFPHVVTIKKKKKNVIWCSAVRRRMKIKKLFTRSGLSEAFFLARTVRVCGPPPTLHSSKKNLAHNPNPHIFGCG